MAVKWGIIGAGRIAHDFVTCLKNLPESEHQVVAIADVSLETAKRFAAEFDITVAYGSFKELCSDKNTEIAYVANLNPDHYWISKLLLEAGKHVLCEKAMCRNLTETEDLVETARKHNRFLMEGLWVRFFPIYNHLRQELAAGTIGIPNLVNVTFAINGKTMYENLDRTLKRSLGGSVMLDTGVYAVQFASLVYGGEKPQRVVTSGFLSEEEVDDVALISLVYSKGRIANLTISIRSEGCNDAIVSGPKGYIKINHPFCNPIEMETPGKTYKVEPLKLKGKFNWTNAEGLTYEAQHVRECLRKGLLESPLNTLDEAKVISYIITEVRKQLGAVDDYKPSVGEYIAMKTK